MNCCELIPEALLREGKMLPYQSACAECRAKWMRAYKQDLKARKARQKRQARETEAQRRREWKTRQAEERREKLRQEAEQRRAAKAAAKKAARQAQYSERKARLAEQSRLAGLTKVDPADRLGLPRMF